MLRNLNGYELCRWQVYERIHGPLDNSWRDEATSVLIDQLQYNTYITGGVGQAKKNPASKPVPFTRPWELWEKAKAEAAKKSGSTMDFDGEIILEEGEVNPFK